MRALTISGSDSGGGAGLQADLKTFERFGAFGTSAVTLITAQNTCGVTAIHLLPPDLVQHQILAVLDDIGADAIKTGSTGSAEIIEVIAQTLNAHTGVSSGQVPLVVDPVMVSKHGDPLLADSASKAMRTHLIPLATLITPNLHEASALLGRPVVSVADMEQAAAELTQLGCQAALITGGALAGDEATDVLYADGALHHFSAPHLDTPNTHGTGCTYSAAITALMAAHTPLLEAVAQARSYIQRAIATAPEIGVGTTGPVNHRA